jgi:hypothetical protein
MATCYIKRSFAYGERPCKQYNKGKTLEIKGEALKFAKEKGCVDVLSGDEPDVQIDMVSE